MERLNGHEAKAGPHQGRLTTAGCTRRQGVHREEESEGLREKPGANRWGNPKMNRRPKVGKVELHL